jgi:hypothetical protein
MSERGAARASAAVATARVNLLPPEIEEGKRAGRTRVGIIGLAVAAVLVVVAAIGVTVFLAAAAQARLLAAQDETIQILQEQNEFVEARALALRVDTVEAAQQAGTLTEIEMQALIRAVDATVPGGVLVSSFAIDSASPIEEFPVPSSPLERPRTAILILTALVPNLDTIEPWVTGLKNLIGFADVFVSNAARDESTGSYEVTITVNLNDALYRGRFAPVDETAAADSDTETGATESTPTPTPTAPPVEATPAPEEEVSE